MKLISNLAMLVLVLTVVGCVASNPTVLKPNKDKPVRIYGFEECMEADKNKEDRKCLQKR